ncbi:MAG: hypothetical protein JSS03_09185 [Proteobacteria bacterium]|nr:hypothetical protein [Pseudomonadota bacterium]
MRLIAAAAFSLFAWMLIATAAHANPGDLNRCVGADGRSIYTDQSCDQIGASVKPQAPDIAGSNRGVSSPRVHVHVRDCAKSLDALRDGVQAALLAGDVNQLAGFYQWTGMGSSAAEGVMDRLAAMTARPFVAVTLLHASGTPRTPSSDAIDPATAANAPPERASGIAIDQSRSANDPTPVRTVLGVSAYMGCWWVRF